MTLDQAIAEANREYQLVVVIMCRSLRVLNPWAIIPKAENQRELHVPPCRPTAPHGTIR